LKSFGTVTSSILIDVSVILSFSTERRVRADLFGLELGLLEPELPVPIVLLRVPMTRVGEGEFRARTGLLELFEPASSMLVDGLTTLVYGEWKV